jgi:solute carrier family 8 (sodium/calcium exchanger)
MEWSEKKYACLSIKKSPNGFVEEYYDEQQCYSVLILVPGTSLMSSGFLGVMYLLFLGYLFLGISIIADIFMEAIEVITSKTSQVDVYDKSGKNKIGTIEVPVWNPTIANLTLMALGSSAPEILLSVIEALSNLGEKAGELGPSTIVGSAAFNLLCITAVSVVAVDEPKWINDRGVFFTTAIFSIFAYIWVLVVLSSWTPNEVSITEAFLTLAFFFILVILAFGADKYNQFQQDKLKSEDDEKKDSEEQYVKVKKNALRIIAKNLG